MLFSPRLPIAAYAAVGLSIAMAYGSSSGAVAGEVSAQPDGAIIWQAGVDGPKIEWNVDGSFRRIFSRYATPVEFPDRRGIYKAQVIAEEKAKAAIIRYLKQYLTSTHTGKEIEDDVEKATRERNTGNNPNFTKTNSRTLVSNLTEVTTSVASGTLRGVVVLEKGYDEKAEEAWAVVGISNDSIRAAEALKGATDPSGERTSSGIVRGSGRGAHQVNDGLRAQPSEVRRLDQTNW